MIRMTIKYRFSRDQLSTKNTYHLRYDRWFENKDLEHLDIFDRLTIIDKYTPLPLTKKRKYKKSSNISLWRRNNYRIEYVANRVSTKTTMKSLLEHYPQEFVVNDALPIHKTLIPFLLREFGHLNSLAKLEHKLLTDAQYRLLDNMFKSTPMFDEQPTVDMFGQPIRRF